jgi:hypothetical protein
MLGSGGRRRGCAWPCDGLHACCQQVRVAAFAATRGQRVCVWCVRCDVHAPRHASGHVGACCVRPGAWARLL